MTRDWLIQRIPFGCRADALSILAVLTVTTVAAAHLLAGGTLVGQDSATQAYPWYSYLGAQLRALEIPGWNPFQFAGAPFVADPQSGWTYVPAMLTFALLPLAIAVPVFLWVHLALAGTGVYLLSRALGMPPLAAVVAGCAYQLTGPVYGRSVCCPAAMEVAVWSPWVLAGTEVAIRAGSRSGRLGGWTLAGFALSQALAVWLGQGSYYLLLTLAGFIVFRLLIAPSTDLPFLVRARDATMHGAAIVGIGFGMGAAGVLPRLDYIARSNLTGGEYAGDNAWAARISGATAEAVFPRLLTPTLHYPGAATLALALVGLMVARRRFAAPFFATLGVVAAVLASPEPTPLHQLLFALLPRFEDLHQHWPERVSLVAYLAPAMLAGAAIAVLIEQPKPAWRRGPAIVIPAVVAIALWATGAEVPGEAFLAVGAAVVLPLALIAMPAPALRRAVPVLLVVVIAADSLVSLRAVALNAPYGGFHRVDLEEYYSSPAAAAFLRDRTRTEPSRFFGYDPNLRATHDDHAVLYRDEFANPATRALVVNNRAMMLGLHDIQGYNPVQVQRYVEFMAALNGHPQDYHDASIFPSGSDSPLLNVLNVRYVVVPSDMRYRQQGDMQWLNERFPTVYEDADIRVLENPAALPRAWIVHDARQVASGEALDLLASGTVDPRVTALVERPAPAMARATAPGIEQVRILEHEPDRIRARATTGAAGMVVFSEIFDPGWHAYVDGKPAPLYLVDHVLRGIPVGAGAHIIDLRYRTPDLLLGVAITGITVAVLAGAALILVGSRRPPRVGSRELNRPGSLPVRPPSARFGRFAWRARRRRGT